MNNVVELLKKLSNKNCVMCMGKYFPHDTKFTPDLSTVKNTNTQISVWGTTEDGRKVVKYWDMFSKDLNENTLEYFVFSMLPVKEGEVYSANLANIVISMPIDLLDEYYKWGIENTPTVEETLKRFM